MPAGVMMRRRIGYAVAFVLAIYGLLVGRAMWLALEFRDLPNLAQARSFFASEWPHDVLARWIVMKPGGDAYSQDLRSWIYRGTVKPADTLWNRWLLERDVAEMSSSELAEYLPSYPLRPGPALLPHLQKLLLAGDCTALPLLAKIGNAESLALYRDWVDGTLVKGGDAQAFVDQFGCLVDSLAMPPSRLLRTFWPRLSARQRGKLLYTAADALTDPEVAADLLGWIRGAVAGSSLTLAHHGLPPLLHKLLSLDPVRPDTLTLLDRHIHQVPPQEVEVLVQQLKPEVVQEVVDRLFSGARAHDAQTAVALFHELAHADIAAAERFARPLLSASDSELRKGIIVVLIRHGSEMSLRHIDETFTGNAARRTRFARIDQYIYGSRAADSYREVSGHDYMEVGKAWPPNRHRASDDPLTEERRWAEFIRRYPWFPGTDDAYYRLAYSQYARGDFKAALGTLRDYFGREHPDVDAEPYLLFLVRTMALEEAAAWSDPVLDRIRTILIDPPGKALWLNFEVPEVVEALRALRAEPRDLRLLGATAEEAALMERIAARIGNLDRREQLVIARRELEDGASLPGVLYGWFIRSPLELPGGPAPLEQDPSVAAFHLAAGEMRYSIRLAEIRDDSAIVPEDLAVLSWGLVHSRSWRGRYLEGGEQWWSLFDAYFEEQQ